MFGRSLQRTRASRHSRLGFALLCASAGFKAFRHPIRSTTGVEGGAPLPDRGERFLMYGVEAEMRDGLSSVAGQNQAIGGDV